MYRDPLHVPSANLVIWHKGREHSILNKRLLDRQNCWENLEAIKDLHRERLELFDEMQTETDSGLLLMYNALCDVIEFELQELWKFPQDANYHRFWERPKCTCPKFDNIDFYPYRRVISGDCVLHGG